MSPNISFDSINIDNIHVKRLLYWLFFASKGGITRLKIIKSLLKSPLNRNELSVILNLNYRTVEHHIKVLIENNVLEGDFRRYDSIFYVKESMIPYLREISRVFEENGVDEK